MTPGGIGAAKGAHQQIVVHAHTVEELAALGQMNHPQSEELIRRHALYVVTGKAHLAAGDRTTSSEDRAIAEVLSVCSNRGSALAPR